MHRDDLLALVKKLGRSQPQLVSQMMEQVEQDSHQDSTPPPPPPRALPLPDWCFCGHCEEMPNPEENICCHSARVNARHPCKSEQAYMALYILDPIVLEMARRQYNDVFAGELEVGNRNRSLRYSAYRQWVLWDKGRLGQGVRIVIPSCCV